MPICPFCRKLIHAGAKEQCPACSYKLEQAEEHFGRGLVEFPRVLDAAGVFSRDERRKLMDFLETLEKRVSPVALGVYLTDRGRRGELAIHAHWLLNHLKINHASFGARGYKLAVEEGGLQMNLGGDLAPEQTFTPLVPSAWDKVKKTFKPLLSQLKSFKEQLFDTPVLPVKADWMLILVMDVQLGQACFVWGYQLDQYLDIEKVSHSITSAHMLFREKDVLAGIKKVMRSVVGEIAKDAKGVNAEYKLFKQNQAKVSLPDTLKDAAQSGANEVKKAIKGAMLFSLALFTYQSGLTQAQEAPNTELEDVLLIPSDPSIDSNLDLTLPIAAEAVPEEQGTLSVSAEEPLLPRIFYGSPASLQYFPSSGTLEEQMGVKTSRVLFASPLPVNVDADQAKLKVDQSSPTSKDADKSEGLDEVPPLILDPWQPRTPPMEGASLQDEEFVLSDLARQDIESFLRESNANKPYHIYISIVNAKHGQVSSFSADALLPLIASLGEQALLLQYHVGSSTPVEIGTQGLNLLPEQKEQWLDALSTAVQLYSDERAALLVLVEHAGTLLDAQVPYLRKDGVDDTLYLPKANVGLEAAAQAAALAKSQKEPSWLDKSKSQLAPAASYAWLILSCIISCLIFWAWSLWYNRSTKLIDLPLDKRLSSPKGAGVSSVVFYKRSYFGRRIEDEESM